MCQSWCSAVAIICLIGAIEVISAQNDIMDPNYGRDPMTTYNSQGGQGTWFDSAKNALAGPAGQMVVHMAKEMISRSAGNSQVCTHMYAYLSRRYFNQSSNTQNL